MSNLTTMGLIILVLAVAVGVSVQLLGGAHSLGSYGPIVGLFGVIAGANLIFHGDRLTGFLAVVSLVTMASLTLRRKLPMLGLFTVSFAIMVHVIAGNAIDLALSIGLFVMLLLGINMIILGVNGGFK
uniref:Uncharacterized protein n=1 Tax=Leersia perrieri TaxID=77586 RepID=A0A0D9X529_9ORYZ